MSHYEERLEQDLKEIRHRIQTVGDRVERALEDSVHAVLTHNQELASEVVLGDLRINREVRAIDRLCHAFVARHLPSAGHLRFVSSVMRLTLEIERVGDYAVSLGRHTEQLPGPPPERIARDIGLMAEPSRRMFAQAVKAFVEGNAELARGTIAMAKPIETSFRTVFADLIELGEKGGEDLKSLFSLLVIFNRLGRVADQAKNLCEETLFAVAGETKKAKKYRILFLDERNDGVGLMAEAFARKGFDDFGEYSSAGWKPAEKVDPRWLDVMRAKGLDHGDLAPSGLDLTSEELSSLHLLIGLNGDPRDHLDGSVPFHSVCRQWQISDDPEEGLAQLRSHITELMDVLHGDSAIGDGSD